MSDLYHLWGNDISLSSTGDLLLVQGSEKGRQRIIRRLCSNPATEEAHGDLIFDGDYGAGLPRRVGSTNSPMTIGTVARHQLHSEAAVSQEPPPQVRVIPFFGGMTVHITYADSETGDAISAGFDIEK
jgi:hypothetical protein